MSYKLIIFIQKSMQNVNLNLLKGLDALLSTKNVSLAGEKMGVTQSAMSLVLKQLRTIYKDDLLTRGTHGTLELSVLAQSLIQPVRETLYQANAVFTTHIPFEPKESTRTFHLGMSDYIAFRLLPKLMQIIANIAPNVRIVQHAINHLDNLKSFENFSLDLVLGQFLSAPNLLKTTHLFHDHRILVADRNHPIFFEKLLDINKLLEYPQIFVSMEAQPEVNKIAEMFKKMGHAVKISLMTPHTLIALQALPKTLLVTHTVLGLAEPFLEPLALSFCETPTYPMPEYHAKMYWHPRDHQDSGHQWIRGLMKNISEEL